MLINVSILQLLLWDQLLIIIFYVMFKKEEFYLQEMHAWY